MFFDKYKFIIYNLKVQDKITIALTGLAVYNELTLYGNNINVMPSISYSNINIATYDYVTGLITPIATGEVIIFVSVKIDEQTTVTKQFTVEVVEQVIFIEAQNNYTVNKGQFFYIVYQILDNSSQSGIATSQLVDAQIIPINNVATILEIEYGYIFIRAENIAGSDILKLIYLQDTNIVLNILINVI